MNKLIYFSAITLMIISLSSCGMFFKHATLSIENDSGQEIEITVDEVTSIVPDKAEQQVDIVWNNDKGNIHRHPFSYAFISDGFKVTTSCYITMYNFETTYLEFTSIQGLEPVSTSNNTVYHCTFEAK